MRKEALARDVEQTTRRIDDTDEVPRVAPGMQTIWINDGVPTLVVGRKDGSVWGVALTQLRTPRGS